MYWFANKYHKCQFRNQELEMIFKEGYQLGLEKGMEIDKYKSWIRIIVVISGFVFAWWLHSGSC